MRILVFNSIFRFLARYPPPTPASIIYFASILRVCSVLTAYFTLASVACRAPRSCTRNPSTFPLYHLRNPISDISVGYFAILDYLKLLLSFPTSCHFSRQTLRKGCGLDLAHQDDQIVGLHE